MLQAWQVLAVLNLSVEDKSDGVEKAIWESEQCQSDLVIGVELFQQQRAELRALLATYKEVLNNAPGHTLLVEHHIENGKAKPYCHYIVFHTRIGKRYTWNYKRCWTVEVLNRQQVNGLHLFC